MKQVDPTSLQVLVSDFSLVLHSDRSVSALDLQVVQISALGLALLPRLLHSGQTSALAEYYFLWL